MTALLVYLLDRTATGISVERFATLSPEKILKEDLETVLLVDNGDNILGQFRAEPYWKQLQAVKRDRVYVFDYYGLVNPGSIGSIEKTCTQLRKIASLQ
jgi:iron complex transport system substrate-binding protein